MHPSVALKSYLYIAIVAPSLLSSVKIALLLLLIMVSLLIIWRQELKFDKYVFVILLSFICYLLFSALLSEIHGYEYGFGQIKNFILNLVASVLIGVAFSRYVMMYDVHRIIISSAVLVVSLLFFYSSYILIDFYFMSGGVNAIAYGHYFGGVVLSDDRLQIRSIAQTPLIFLSTYYIVYFSHENNNKITAKNIVFFLMLLLVVATSGRRALQLSFVLSALYYLVMFVLTSSNYKGRSIFVFFAGAGAIFVFIASNMSILMVVMDTFLDGFDVDSNSAGLKYEQFFPLLEHWSNAPFLGNGLYSYPDSYVRSVDYKYSFELVYLATLGQIGVLGFLYIVSLFIFALLKVYVNRIVPNDCSVQSVRSISNAVIISSIMFFIMGSTNPMIYMNWFWVIIVLLSSQSNNKYIIGSLGLYKPGSYNKRAGLSRE